MTTLKEICEEVKIEPVLARRILRTQGVEKPGKSWVWDKKPVKVVNMLKQVAQQISGPDEKSDQKPGNTK